MKILSLFDGISCGMVALERAGMPVERYVAYEIDKYAIQVSKANYPQIEHHGDVTTADFTQYKGFDMVIGGSPCQDLSICKSKKRQGLQGAKSKLFYEYVRALKEVCPKYFMLENNYSMPKESVDIITEILGVKPIMIDSGLLSAQERKRWYWTNIPNIEQPKEKGLVINDIKQQYVDEKYFYQQSFDYHGEKKPVIATLHINGHDILKRVQNPAFKCHTLTTCGGGNTQKKILEHGRCRKLTPVEYERLQTLPDNYTACVSDTHRYTTIGNGWTVDVIAHILRHIQ